MITKEKLKTAWDKHPIALTIGVLAVLVGCYDIYKRSK